jgi:hypothetical protein
MLRRLGFDQLKPAENRADRHDLYCVAFTDLAEKISEICGKRFPDDAVEKIFPKLKKSTQ